MPMPPTSKEIDATLPSKHGHDPSRGRRRLGNIGKIAHVEIVFALGTDAVALAQKQSNLFLGFFHPLGAHRLDDDALHPGDAHEPLLHGRVGNHDGVVLIRALSRLPFAREHADHSERDVSDADDRVERIVVAEQLTRDGFADHGDFGGAVHVAFVKKTALGDLPVADLLELRRDSLSQSAPVQVSRDHLILAPQDRRRKRHRRQLARHRLGIAIEQRIDVAEAGSDAALHVAAGQDDQNVGAERGDLRADRRLGAFADGDHRDDRADADDDAEHRQESAQLVSRQRAQRNS